MRPYVVSTARSSSTTRIENFLSAAIFFWFIPLVQRGTTTKLLPHCRQFDLEDRSLPDLATHRNLSAVVANDSANDPQAETGSFLAFGGHKRLEDTFLQVLRDSRTGIRDKNTNISERELFTGAHMTRAYL